MFDTTREQEDRIANLACFHGRLRITPPDHENGEIVVKCLRDRTIEREVRIDADGRTMADTGRLVDGAPTVGVAS